MKLREYIDWKPTIPSLLPPGHMDEQQEQDDRELARISTIKAPAMNRERGRVEDTRSITESLRAMSTLSLPIPGALHRHHRRYNKPQAHTPRDIMAWLVGLVATITSLCATIYYYNAHEILLYSDARSHMRIARSVFDSLTPGIAQLGSVWLPLPHILMWPFVWNDFLWHSGLAGSFVAMLCYVLSCLLIYLTVQRITGNITVSFLGTLVFVFNANILYLQSTPLSELVCIATYLLAIYCFLLWVDSGGSSTNYLVLVGFTTFLATLARYDGWPLALAILCAVPIAGIIQRKEKGCIGSETMLYAFPGLFGMMLWVLWNGIIFGDPLYFARGPYSSLVQQTLQLHVGNLFAYHNLWLALKTYSVDTLQTLGMPLTLCVICCLCLTFLGRFRLTHKLTLLLLLAVFVFYVYSLYGGQAIIWIPGANPRGLHIYMYNVRYGSQMVAPAAIFLGTGISVIKTVPWIWLKWITWLEVGVLIIVQSLLLLAPGSISLQDGQFNVMCAPHRTIDAFIYQHYDRGLILDDVANFQFDTTFAGIDFKNVVYEGSGHYWREALAHPEQHVIWVVINPSQVSTDIVAQHIHLNNLTFLTNFTLVARQSDGTLLFHHNGLPSLPNRMPMPQYSYPHAPCLY